MESIGAKAKRSMIQRKFRASTNELQEGRDPGPGGTKKHGCTRVIYRRSVGHVFAGGTLSTRGHIL